MNDGNVVHYTMEWYLAVMKNEVMQFAGRWMELEATILNEVMQTAKDKYHLFSLKCKLSFRFVCHNQNNHRWWVPSKESGEKKGSLKEREIEGSVVERYMGTKIEALNKEGDGSTG